MLTASESDPASPLRLRLAAPMPSRSPPSHPAGFYVVCLAVFWERWAAYMLGSSLVLMLCERYGYARGDALRLAGLVSAATYLGTLPGGIASDRALGPCRWLGLSMVLLALGYAALTLSVPGALGLSLALLVVGHALFKPNTQAVIARLYASGDPRLDAAQILFYIAVNAGAALGSMVAGLLVSRASWGVAFVLAAAAMLAGTLALVAGRKALQLRPASARSKHPAIPKADTTPASAARSDVKALGALLAAILLYTLGCGQVEGSLFLWAQDQTNRALLGVEIPAAWFVGLPAVLVLLLAPVQLGLLPSLQRRINTPRLVALGLLSVSAAFVVLLPPVISESAQRVSMGWLVACLTLLSAGELLVAPLGLSLLLRLAPPRLVGAVVGAWYVTRALGFWLAGELGALWMRGSPVLVLGLLIGSSFVGAVLLWRTRLGLFCSSKPAHG